MRVGQKIGRSKRLLVNEAITAGLLPKEKRGSATGYAGVIEIKGKYQARLYDTARKKQRALPRPRTRRRSQLHWLWHAP